MNMYKNKALHSNKIYKANCEKLSHNISRFKTNQNHVKAAYQHTSLNIGYQNFQCF